MAEWTEIVWEAPVTDRVEADCVYGNPKGCLDAAVMNRLDKNITYIKAYMDYYKVDYNKINTRDADWTRYLYIKLADFGRMQKDINEMYDAALRKTATQRIVLSEANAQINYILLNQMEQLLLDAKNMLDNMVDMFLYSGDSYCGNFEIGG